MPSGDHSTPGMRITLGHTGVGAGICDVQSGHAATNAPILTRSRCYRAVAGHERAKAPAAPEPPNGRQISGTAAGTRDHGDVAREAWSVHGVSGRSRLPRAAWRYSASRVEPEPNATREVSVDHVVASLHADLRSREACRLPTPARPHIGRRSTAAWTDEGSHEHRRLPIPPISSAQMIWTAAHSKHEPNAGRLPLDTGQPRDPPGPQRLCLTTEVGRSTAGRSPCWSRPD